MTKRFPSIKFLLPLFAIVAFLIAVPAIASAAARIVIVNLDGPGEGFNDPTPAAPIGGNPGTTIGQQRLIAFQYAADIWGANLDSNVEIRVQGQFNPLQCTPTRIVLGSAGAISVARDFPGAEFPRTFYHIALANKRSNQDRIPAGNDINAQFNSSYGGLNPDGTPCGTQGAGFYLGLDNNEAPGQADLVTTLLHEFAHGLGFSAFVNVTTGAKFNGLDDIFIKFAVDTTTGKRFTDQTNAERAASIINPRRVIWDGANVTAAAPSVLSRGVPVLNINSPANIARDYEVGEASFGPRLTAAGVTGNVVLANDGSTAGTGGTTTDACEPLVNASAVSGNIALVDRGVCGFAIKVKNAQDAGAIAVIVADNVAGGPPPGLGGSDPTITIPSVRITLADGNTIKAALANNQTVNATLRLDTNRLAGTDALGRVLLNTPNPVVPGSSLSHWDPIAFRNLLMEPAISDDLTSSVKPPEDLTLPQMRDIGWFADANADGLPDGVDVSSPIFRLTSTVTRDCATGEYVARITLTNSGTSTVNNVQVSDVTLGGVGSTSFIIPGGRGVFLLDKFAPGQSKVVTVRFPASAGVAGTRAPLIVYGDQSTTFLSGTFSVGNTKLLPAACAQ